MAKQVLAAFFVLALSMAFSANTFAAEEKKMDEASKKAEVAMGPMKSMTCECGFSCKGHDEKELIGICKTHSKTHHKMTVSDKDAKAMLKSEEEAPAAPAAPAAAPMK